MRSADAVTAIRIALVFVIAYLIINFGAVNPLLQYPLDAEIVVLLMLVMFGLDNLDGYFATRKNPSLGDFVSYLGKEIRGKEQSKSKSALKPPAYGAALDIAGDRITEYTFWIVFTYLQIIPIYVVLIIMTRNCLADALTLSKGKTFSKMRSAFGRVASSHMSRALYQVVKASTIIYLSLVYLAGWPLWIGDALVVVAVAYSLLRGAAEIYEAWV
jgi:phosphatidylglycerophosphate synthase